MRNAVILTAGCMAMLIVLPIAVYGAVKRHAARAQQKRLTDACVMQAINTLRRMDCPAVYIRGDQFCSMGGLRPHEELRDAGILTYKDRIDELSTVDHFSVFLSHQWLANDHPDPDGVQYPVMVAAVRKLAESLLDGSFANSRFLCHSVSSSATTVTGSTFEGSVSTEQERLQRMLSRIYIWVDYISIPQIPCELQKLAIHTLSSYCSSASAFIVIAPIATQKNTGQQCDFTSYQTRMWYARSGPACDKMRPQRAQYVGHAAHAWGRQLSRTCVRRHFGRTPRCHWSFPVVHVRAPCSAHGCGS